MGNLPVFFLSEVLSWSLSFVYWGNKFSKDYVYNRHVERNSTVPHRFVCLTDQALDGIDTLILR